MPKKSTRLIFRPEVVDRVGVTYVTIWQWMQAGKFPRSLALGGPGRANRVAWHEHEIDAWLANLPRRRLKGDKVEA
jgi:prophage regulatory protein